MVKKTNVSSGFFRFFFFIVDYLPDYSDANNGASLLVGRYWTEIFVWIPKYVFDKDTEYIKENNDEGIVEGLDKNRNIIFLVDRNIARNIKEVEDKLDLLDLNTDPKITVDDKRSNHYNRSIYPYNNLDTNREIGRILVKANFS